jgi:hypothetical protein
VEKEAEMKEKDLSAVGYREFIKHCGFTGNASLVSEEERTQLLLNLEATHGRAALTPELIDWALDWALDIKIRNGLLTNVLRGDFELHSIAGDPAFKLTPAAMKKAEAMIADLQKRGGNEPPRCPTCNGTGNNPKVDPGETPTVKRCPTCGGTGRLDAK